jgi:hypothetical protein
MRASPTSIASLLAAVALAACDASGAVDHGRDDELAPDAGGEPSAACYGGAAGSIGGSVAGAFEALRTQPVYALWDATPNVVDATFAAQMISLRSRDAVCGTFAKEAGDFWIQFVFGNQPIAPGTYPIVGLPAETTGTFVYAEVRTFDADATATLEFADRGSITIDETGSCLRGRYALEFDVEDDPDFVEGILSGTLSGEIAAFDRDACPAAR